MLRLLIAAFLTLISVSAHAQSNNAWYAQAMLSRLGYQISVDGSWGPQSQRAIRQFYADQGLTYDENLNDSEFADLITAIADQPYIHPRANLVNYEPQYQFLSGSWPYLDLDEYRRKFTEIYGIRSIWSDAWSRVLSQECRTEFLNFNTFENINLGNNDVTRVSETEKLAYCLFALPDAAHQDFIMRGSDSRVLNYFFETLIPIWTQNGAYSARGMRSVFGDTSAGYTFATNIIAFVYTR